MWIDLQGPGVPALKVIYHTSQNSLAAKRTIFGKLGIRPAVLICNLIRKIIVYHIKLPGETWDVPAEKDAVQHSGNRARKRFPQCQLFHQSIHDPVRRFPHGFPEKVFPVFLGGKAGRAMNPDLTFADAGEAFCGRRRSRSGRC